MFESVTYMTLKYNAPFEPPEPIHFMQFRAVFSRTLSTVVALTLMVFGGTLAVLQAVAPDVYTFVLKIGSFGPGASEFAFPLGVATDLQNRIYIADTETDDLSVANDRIQIFNEDGSYLATIGGPGTGNGQFVYPFGVVVDQNGWVLVADSGNNRIQLFDPTRQFVTSFGTYGNYDTSPTGPPEYRDANGNYIGPTPTLTGLNFPTRVALRPGTRLNDQTDTEGRVAVLDNSNHRVVMLDARLNPLFSFGSFGTDGNALGNFEYPIGVAMDADRVYVADPANHRIQIFTLTGAPIAAFGSKGPANTPDDLQNPYDVQPDSQGRLFVADTDRSRILVLNPDPTTPQTPRCSDVDGAAAAGRCAILATDGTWYDARVLGAAGIGDGEFSFPQALSIDQSARLVVADSDNHRFQVFRGAKIRVSSATLLTAGPVESGQTVTVSVTIANEGATSLMVTPSLTPSLSGTLTSPAPAQIAASATAVFPFSFVTDNIGTLSFTAGGTGQPPVGASIIAPPVTTNSIAVTAAPVPKMNLGIGVTSPAGGSGGLGATVTVQVTVTNTGNVPLTQVTPSVDPSPAGLVIDTTMIQPDLGPLEAGASRPFTFTFTVALVGTVTFRAGATATYAVATPPGGTASISTATSAGPSTTFRVADDVIPPATTIALSTQPTDTGWYRTPVQVTLTASDNVAVRAINYRISGLAAGAASVAGNTATLTISAQGGSDLTYWATDTSGLVETPHTIHFDVDTVLPGISRGGVTPAPNAAGWNNTPPTVKFIGSDGESGVAFVTPDVTDDQQREPGGHGHSEGLRRQHVADDDHGQRRHEAALGILRGDDRGQPARLVHELGGGDHQVHRDRSDRPFRNPERQRGLSIDIAYPYRHDDHHAYRHARGGPAHGECLLHDQSGGRPHPRLR